MNKPRTSKNYGNTKRRAIFDRAVLENTTTKKWRSKHSSTKFPEIQMRVMGIDPGTATTGFSILERDKNSFRLLDYGCITTEAKTPANIRLNQIAQDLKTLIKKWEPTHASIEKLFFNKNVKTAISVAQARGVVIQILTEYGIDPREFTPLEIKSAVCGYGRADKKMVQEMIKTMLNLKVIPRPDDAADAIATAICAINTMQYK